MQITLPLRTVSEANRREHWATRARRAKGQRTVTRLEVARKLGYGRTPAIDFPVAATLTRIAPRALDDDNLRGALKAVRDGVADALGVDDRDPRVEWCYGQRKGKPAVEINLEARS